jgi:hypothetical protein
LYRLLSSGLDEHTLRSTLATLRTVRRRLERSDYAQMPMFTADSESFARAGLTRARCA